MIATRALALAVLAALCWPVAAPGPAIAADRALIIGVDKYANLPPEKQLRGAVNDARLIEQLAREHWKFPADGVKMLLDEQATAAAIRSTIDTWLIAGTSTGDRVLLYYSGHGSYISDQDGDETDGRDETLAPHDTTMTGNMVTDDEIRGRVAKLAGRNVMVIADSCHSGTITRALRPEPKTEPNAVRSLNWPLGATRGGGEVSEQQFQAIRRGISIFGTSPGVVAWTAVSPSELAEEDATLAPAQRHGVFTKAFFEGISNRAADANGDGRVTMAELLQHTRTKAAAYCERGCATGMTPTLDADTSKLARDLAVWPVSDAQPSAGGGAPPVTVSEVLPQPAGAFQVSVALPAAQMPLGSKLQVSVTSSKDGYLIVLDVREDGKVVQLFPSVCTHPSRQIRAGAAIKIPDPSYGCEFTATDPGRGEIVAIVTQDNVKLEELLNRNKGVEVIANPVTYVGEIAQALLGVWTQDPQNRPVHWGLGRAAYENR